MSGDGVVHAIHVAPAQGAPVEARRSVVAEAGRGLRGDRYFHEEGTFAGRDGSDLTLIEREALAAVERDHDIDLEPGAHRRNVTTAGIALNHLVDERFQVGGAVCVGEELCEPCSYLERHLEREGVREALVHRGGLRARVVETGPIAVGDAVLTANGDGPEN
jgi:MOSC domain-containing protein YiiM